MEIQSVKQYGVYEKIGPVRLPLEIGNKVEEFEAWYYGFPRGRYAAWIRGQLSEAANPLVRLQSSCIWGNLFGSCYCDCRWQMDESKRLIVEEGAGLIIYALDH